MTTLEARELRIGNYFLDRGGKLIQLHYWESAGKIAQNMVVGGMTVHPMTENVEYLMPIPLTEEWLLKLGLYKSIENAGNLECYKKGNITIAKWIGDKWKVWIDSKDLRKSPKHVHQIQNLYHALTGEELEIKEQ